MDARPLNELDNLVDLYTKEFGRLRARVTSGRKILSKLSPHLDPLNLVTVRLVEKKQFIVADAVTLDRFQSLRSSQKLKTALQLVRLLSFLSFTADPDLRLWHWLNRSLKKGPIKFKEFLKILGYDSAAARCEDCGSKNVSYFSATDQSFLCRRCHTHYSPSKLLYIG